MKKIGIVVNPHKEPALALLSKTKDWLEKRDLSVVDSLSGDIESVFRDSALVICLGGDGTLLSAAGKTADSQTPILGVNLGSLGFLTEVKEDEVFEELTAFLSGQSQVEEHVMLSCNIRSDASKQERRLKALNDIVVSREGLSRILDLDVRIGGESLTSFAGDGVIVATPTGSTAYSFSAGGSIVHPRLNNFIITPICPHSSALRSMVVDGDEKITVKLLTEKRGHNKALVTADGQENFQIDDSYTVEITRSSTKLKLVKSSKRSYIANLRENFRFP